MIQKPENKKVLNHVRDGIVSLKLAIHFCTGERLQRLLELLVRMEAEELILEKES